MSDYLDFQYNLKGLSKLCASDEHTQYTRFYKFEHPNCHRIQGGLRTGRKEIRVALILFPDSDDEHLVWPVELEYKVLAYVNGKTELLTKKKIKRNAEDVEVFSEDNSWRDSTSVSLNELKEKNLIGPDDSVTFIWSVKLCCPPRESLQAGAKYPVLHEDILTQAENVKYPDTQRKLKETSSLFGSMDSGIDTPSVHNFAPSEVISEEEVNYPLEGISKRRANEEENSSLYGTIRSNDSGIEVHERPRLTFNPSSKEKERSNVEGISYRKAKEEGNGCLKTAEHEKMAYGSKDCTDLLLVGRTGSGKSALGNTILRTKRFMSMDCTEPVTKEFDFDFSEFEGRPIKVVDGPELGEPRLNYNEAAKCVASKMSKAICTSTKGFHAILLVVRYGGRFTREDMNTVNILKKIFGEKFITDHAILVITWGDCFSTDAEDTKQTFEQWCAEQKGGFQQLYTDVQKRAILFDNRTKERSIISDQLRSLLALVDSMCARYTTKMFDEAAKARDNLLRAEKCRTLNEDAVREAGLITHLLGRVSYINPWERPKQLQDLKKRTVVLLKDILDKNKGTNSYPVAIKMTQNLEATITEQLKEMQRVFDKMQQDQLEQTERPDPDSDEENNPEERKAEKKLETLRLEKEVQEAGKHKEQRKKGEKELLAEEKAQKKDPTNKGKLPDQTKKLAETKEKALQDLEKFMENTLVEREKDYQNAKGESRAAWMKAAPVLFKKIWSQFVSSSSSSSSSSFVL